MILCLTFRHSSMGSSPFLYCFFCQPHFASWSLLALSLLASMSSKYFFRSPPEARRSLRSFCCASHCSSRSDLELPLPPACHESNHPHRLGLGLWLKQPVKAGLKKPYAAGMRRLSTIRGFIWIGFRWSWFEEEIEGCSLSWSGQLIEIREVSCNFCSKCIVGVLVEPFVWRCALTERIKKSCQGSSLLSRFPSSRSSFYSLSLGTKRRTLFFQPSFLFTRRRPNIVDKDVGFFLVLKRAPSPLSSPLPPPRTG